jgi:hypothetical protein
MRPENTADGSKEARKRERPRTAARGDHRHERQEQKERNRVQDDVVGRDGWAAPMREDGVGDQVIGDPGDDEAEGEAGSAQPRAMSSRTASKP